MFISRGLVVSARSINHAIRIKRPDIKTVNHSTLAECVKQEMKLEKMTTEPLPKFTNFISSLNGCCATLQRKYNNEKSVQLCTDFIIVNINANEPVEVERETNEEEESETIEPLFMPTFSVIITNSISDTLTFECSFDMFGDYDELGDEWDNLSIDTVSIQSKGQPLEIVYKVDPSFLSEHFQKNILTYLEERGIDRSFTSEIVSFYREFEHHNYVNGFLEKFYKFLSNK